MSCRTVLCRRPSGLRQDDYDRMIQRGQGKRPFRRFARVLSQKFVVVLGEQSGFLTRRIDAGNYD